MPEYYWTLTIETGWVQASIWTTQEGEDGKIAKIIAASTPVYWESDEDLVTSVDTSLSDAINDFPESEEEPSKVVFGIPSSWVAEGNIKPEYLEKIRVVCSKLSLEPSGFVVLPEALAYYIKSQEGSPLTGILIGFGKEYLDVSLFKLGNLVGNVSVARSLSLVEDVTEGLTRFPVEEHYPSRFIVYDGKISELEFGRDALSQADWTGNEKVKFLHTPKIEMIDPEEKIVAVSLAGASEIAGAQSVQGLVKKQIGQSLPTFKETESIPKEAANLESQTVDPRELGFSLGQDIGDNFEDRPQTKDLYSHNQPSEFAIHKEESVHQVKKFTPLVFLGRLLRKLKNKSELKLPKVALKAMSGPTHLDSLMANDKPFKFGALALVILFVGLFAAWWFLPKAEVIIYVSPKEISKTQNVFINTGSGSATGSNTLTGKMVTKEVSAQGEVIATGTKTVGEKAKGKVQVRNGTATPVKLTATTVLLSSSNLKFIPLQSASISAATSPTSPGMTTVEAIAEAIGSESNLAKGESFKVGNYPKSEVDGVADSAFSGGSSRDIQAVSADDRESLEEKVTKELEEKGKSAINETLEDSQIIIGDATSVATDQKDFNHKVGDEAKDLKLTLKGNASAPVVSKEDLLKLSKSLLAESVPDGFVLRDEQIENEFTVKSNKGGIIEVEMKVSANLLPSINPDEVAKKITGKSPKFTQDYLSSIASFSRVVIKPTPKLPGRLGALPRVTKNINIEVTAER